MAEVILVDSSDREIGREEKLKAHQLGLLHRAFSILIFNSKSEILIQQRHGEKYHSAGLWSNTCCSHPVPGEKTEDAAQRRLAEEMGFTTKLDYAGNIIYQVRFENDLIEYEYDHIFFGKYDGAVIPHPEEAENYKWITFAELKDSMSEDPEKFSFWFFKIMHEFETEIKNYIR